jgi:hypothetical protein
MTTHVLSAAARLRARIEKGREKVEETVGAAIGMAEVAGGAGAFGYANQRWGQGGELKVMGLPVDLATGIALNGLAFAGMAGKYSEHFHNLGNAGLAAYSYRLGASLAASSSATAGFFTSGRGIHPSMTGQHYAVGSARAEEQRELG